MMCKLLWQCCWCQRNGFSSLQRIFFHLNIYNIYMFNTSANFLRCYRNYFNCCWNAVIFILIKKTIIFIFLFKCHREWSCEMAMSSNIFYFCNVFYWVFYSLKQFNAKISSLNGSNWNTNAENKIGNAARLYFYIISNNLCC